jgi:cystathionine gamma-lyase
MSLSQYAVAPLDDTPIVSPPVSTSSGFGTRAIHSGQHPDPITGAVTVPISLATTFVQKSPGLHTGYEYSRTGNPTRAAFEANIAGIENARYGLAFASGSAATVTIINMLSSGDHVITVDDVYGGTNRYFNRVATPANNMSFSMVDFCAPGAIEAAITPKTKLMWIETPTNPTLKVVDIKNAARIAKQHNIICVVDNTFASPYLQNPLDLGADIVVHSVTKYLGGHSDCVMGVLATNREDIYTKLKFLQNAIGAVPAPFDCYMALRGVKTLHLRMRQHCSNAMTVAKFLESHPLVDRVLYPGLPSHPQHNIAKTQMRDFGGMVTFFIKGGIEESRAFLENLNLFALAESLGAVESLAEHPAIMTHAAVPAEQRKALGISDSLIRLSVGVEDIEDILNDLKTALSKVTPAK